MWKQIWKPRDARLSVVANCNYIVKYQEAFYGGAYWTSNYVLGRSEGETGLTDSVRQQTGLVSSIEVMT